MTRTAFALALLLLPAHISVAQEPSFSTIETKAIGTVETLPTYVEFWFHSHHQGASLSDATAKAQQFGPKIQAELESRQLIAELTLPGVSLPDMHNNEAHVSAKLRFSLAAINSAPNAPQEFVVLCEKVLALAAALRCEAEGPGLGADDAAPIEQAAVALAAERAYPLAESAAQLMGANLVAVDKLIVEKIEWNKDPENKGQQPTLRSVSCTAQVKVIYTYGIP